ncbi:MAG: trimethylamine methyltransferase family protein [Halobacteriales archaeon]
MTDQLETLAIPFPDRLSHEALELIHEKSLTILEELGIEIELEEARELLAEHGCTVEEDSGLVKIPSDLAEECVEAAPGQFTMVGRHSQPDLTLGGEDTILTPTAGPPNIRWYNDDRRPSTMDDFEAFQKIIQMEDVINGGGYGVVEPTDYDESMAYLESHLRVLLMTDTVPIGNAYGRDRAREAAEMVGIAYDDPDLSDYYLITTANSVSPRTWDTKMTEGVMAHAEMEQPIVLAPAVMAAASGPATLPGSMALGNAEILAGITMTQLINEGTPVIYGLPSSNVDVRYGSFSIGSPEGALFISFAGQMSRFYDIPARAGGALTDAKTVDFQAGSESMLQLMMSWSSGIDYILHAGGVMDSYSTASPEKFVLDCDQIRYLQRFDDGYTIDEDTFALDLIEEVEPADHFLNKRHTLEHSRDDFLFPEIAYRDSYDNWEEDGAKDAFERAHERVQNLIDEYERPPVDADIQQELEDYVDAKREEKSL